MKKYFFMSTVGALLLTISSCTNNNQTLVAAEHQSFDTTAIDTAVSAADNFFLYANGRWLKTAVIPDDQSGWGSFFTLYEENLKKLRNILEDAAKEDAAAGTLSQKVGDYYATGMDTVAIEKLGAEPIQPMLARMDLLKNSRELMNLVAENTANGEGSLFGFAVGADEKNSAQNIPIFYQTGLGLPEKDYYTKQDSASKAARQSYVDVATRFFLLSGLDSATAAEDAASVLALETAIARSHRSPAETRDPQKNYNKLSVVQLDRQEPNVGWSKLFAAMNVQVDSINVAQPGYYVALNKLLTTQPIEAWKAKVKLDYISNNADLLSKDFRDAAFNFKKTFTGQKMQADRWKTMVDAVDNGLGELLGQLYVKKYFNDTAKRRMDTLVNNLSTAFENRIAKLDWMSDSTKQMADVKLKAFLKKIGYPTKWKNYDDVTIDSANYFANATAVKRHASKQLINKIGKPVDRTEWGMTPVTVNAYYNPTNNEIVFPAGILQPPFFNAAADDAINYGAIGMVIGHEMTHGFDDQGSQYDDKGNMKNWWGAEDLKRFKEKTAGVVDQYNAYSLFDSLHVKGDLTLGENLADIGGLAIAYDAFKMTKQGQGNEKIDGFTPDQRFFLGFAQVWRIKNRDESARVRLNVDPHSPEMYRVNGPLSNFDPFYAAFNVKEGNKMYIDPKDRARVW